MADCYISRAYRLSHWAEDDFEAKETKELAESLTRGSREAGEEQGILPRKSWISWIGGVILVFPRFIPGC